MQHQVMTALELYEAFGGQEAFFPKSDGLLRESWVSIGCNEFAPAPIAPFKYLNADHCVIYNDKDRIKALNRKYFVLADKYQKIVAVIAYGNKGVASQNAIRCLRNAQVPCTSFNYMGYLSLRKDLSPSYGMEILHRFMQHFGPASIFMSGWVTKSEKLAIQSLASRNDVQLTCCHVEPGSKHANYWHEKQYSTGFNPKKANFYVADSCFMLE